MADAAIRAGQDRGSNERRRRYPETAIDDFTRMDNAVEFYLRVGALVRSDMTVVDYGAGRGQWYVDSRSDTRRQLRDLRRRTARVIGVDIDPAVLENPAVSESRLIESDGRIPLPSESVDLVVSDVTFEHVATPHVVAAELTRILKPGGWICARTPNRHGYIGIGARVVPNGWHARWLTRLQPFRKAVDVFPVCYRLNTTRDIGRYFPDGEYERIVYFMPSEPGYAGNSRILWSAFEMLNRVLPRRCYPMLNMFLRKR